MNRNRSILLLVVPIVLGVASNLSGCRTTVDILPPVSKPVILNVFATHNSMALELLQSTNERLLAIREHASYGDLIKHLRVEATSDSGFLEYVDVRSLRFFMFGGSFPSEAVIARLNTVSYSCRLDVLFTEELCSLLREIVDFCYQYLAESRHLVNQQITAVKEDAHFTPLLIHLIEEEEKPSAFLQEGDTSRLIESLDNNELPAPAIIARLYEIGKSCRIDYGFPAHFCQLINDLVEISYLNKLDLESSLGEHILALREDENFYTLTRSLRRKEYWQDASLEVGDTDMLIDHIRANWWLPPGVIERLIYTSSVCDTDENFTDTQCNLLSELVLLLNYPYAWELSSHTDNSSIVSRENIDSLHIDSLSAEYYQMQKIFDYASDNTFKKGLPIYFAANVKDSDTPIEYHWTIRTTETSNSDRPSYIFEEEGVYIVTLHAVNEAGSDSSSIAFGVIDDGEGIN